MSILQRIRNRLFPQPETDAEEAYDLWAKGYDDQPGNLVLDMDTELFGRLVNEVSLHEKTVADIGCGTGRHWPVLLSHTPRRLIGYDVSSGMLEKLKLKFPGAEVFQLRDHRLDNLADQSCDVIISTLALAHMPDSEAALTEWTRVLKAGGEMIVTDYHPQALRSGGKRTFRHEGKLIAVKNYVHPIQKIREQTRQLGLHEIRFSERVIDESVKDYYVQNRALPLFERFKGVPMIYGLHLKKTDAPARSEVTG